MKIVEFANGKFAVQTSRFLVRMFADLKSGVRISYSRWYSNFKTCQGTKEEATAYANTHNYKIIRTIKL